MRDGRGQLVDGLLDCLGGNRRVEVDGRPGAGRPARPRALVSRTERAALGTVELVQRVVVLPAEILEECDRRLLDQFVLGVASMGVSGLLRELDVEVGHVQLAGNQSREEEVAGLPEQYVLPLKIVQQLSQIGRTVESKGARRRSSGGPTVGCQQPRLLMFCCAAP